MADRNAGARGRLGVTADALRLDLRPLGAVAVLLSAGCDGDATSLEAPRIQVEVVSGDGQEGVAGAALAEPVVFQVVDEGGATVPGTSVFVTRESGVGARLRIGGTLHIGSINELPVDADAAGRITITWELGELVTEVQRIRVSPERAFPGVAGPPAGSAFASASALPGPPATYVPVGDGQEGDPAQALPSPIGVRVLDAYGNRVPGVPLTWMVSSGGGTLASASPSTNALGVGTATWTLGTEGDQVTSVTIQGLGTLEVSATLR